MKCSQRCASADARSSAGDLRRVGAVMLRKTNQIGERTATVRKSNLLGAPSGDPATGTLVRRVPARARGEVAAEIEARQRSDASGSRIALVSGARLYGCSSATSSSWYTDSALTSQRSCSVPSRMFSTARMAVSIEWSELL